MVDFAEKHLPLVEAVFRVTGIRHNYSTLWRWTTDGVQGPSGERIRLEFAKCGRRRSASIEAVKRFIEAQTAAAIGATPQASTTPRARAASVSAAERELAAAGI